MTDMNDLNSAADGGPIGVIRTGSMPNQYAYAAGMSLRDWFAGQAIERMVSLSMDSDGAWHPDTVAAGCYLLADAMLAARSPKQEG